MFSSAFYLHCTRGKISSITEVDSLHTQLPKARQEFSESEKMTTLFGSKSTQKYSGVKIATSSAVKTDIKLDYLKYLPCLNSGVQKIASTLPLGTLRSISLDV